MIVGLFGKAGCGKSTLFRALAGGEGQDAAGRTAEMCTIRVPDDRVDRISRLYHPKKTTHVSITFGEIDPGEAELVPAGTLAKIKGADVLAIVVRGFSDDFHPPPPEGIDPVRDFRGLESELVLADYLVAQKRIERMTKEARRDAEWTILHRAVDVLEKEVPLRGVDFTAEEARILSGFRFASRIPLILVLNVGEGDLGVETYPELGKAAASRGIPLVRLSAKIEEEISQLPPEDQPEFLKSMGLKESVRDRLVRGAYAAMDYVTFITVGDDEVRAWNVRRGTNALAAAGRIHSDLEKGFIRAEVIGWEDLLRCGSMAKAKTEGKLRLEGKEYVVQDGEIVHIRFNV